MMTRRLGDIRTETRSRVSERRSCPPLRLHPWHRWPLSLFLSIVSGRLHAQDICCIATLVKNMGADTDLVVIG